MLEATDALRNLTLGAILNLKSFFLVYDTKTIMILFLGPLVPHRPGESEKSKLFERLFSISKQYIVLQIADIFKLNQKFACLKMTIYFLEKDTSKSFGNS